MEFWLAIRVGRIVRITFTTDGCGASIACGAAAAALAENKAIAEAFSITPERVEAAVGNLPPDHKHCALLAVTALRAALKKLAVVANIGSTMQHQHAGKQIANRMFCNFFVGRDTIIANQENATISQPNTEENNMNTTQSTPETTPAARIPLIGEPAPAFKAHTTQGPIDFPKDYKGKWVILFSHPADFTPVCTTEFMTFAKMQPEFKALNCELVGLSIDSHYAHIAWLRTIKEKIKYKGMSNVEVTFPVIADLKMDVAKAYGMLQPGASDTQAVRAVFVIDPKSIIRAILYYPLSNGRNFQELKRLLVAMQTSDKFGVATPADWQPGDDVIVPPPGSCGTAKERMEKPDPDAYAMDWFITFKKLPKEKLNIPPAANI